MAASAEKVFKCRTCEETFPTKYKHDIHRNRVHNRNPRFRCKHGCNYQASSTHDLIRHTSAVHLKEANFGCNLCDRKFTQEGNLKTHVNAVHLGLRKVLKCRTCDEVFPSKYKHDAHRSRVHIQNPRFRCKHGDCAFQAVAMSDLNRHVADVHLRGGGHFCVRSV